MSTKRKTAQRKQSSDTAANAEKPSWKKSPSIDDRMMAFSNSLHGMRATLKPTPEFEEKWLELLMWHANKEREWLLSQSVSPWGVDRLIQYRWAVLDRTRNAYDFVEQQPSSKSHPIPIVVVNWFGTWDLSPSLHSTVIQHPIYRALKADLPQPTPKNELLQLMRWAMSLSGSQTEEERILSAIAHECDAMIHDVGMFDSCEDEWLRLARHSEDFWSLLQMFFDFGRRHAFWQTYRDGTVAKSSRKGLLMAQKGFDPWSILIHKMLVAERESSGKLLTALHLRKALGAELPDNAGDKLVFADPRCEGLPGITWPQFQERVKESKARIVKNRGI